jgi:hypothetical protein
MPAIEELSTEVNKYDLHITEKESAQETQYPAYARRTRSQVRVRNTKKLLNKNAIDAESDPSFKTNESDTIFNNSDAVTSKSANPKNQVTQRVTRPRASRSSLLKADKGDSRDADIDSKLWIRINLGERCTAAQCTLRNAETHRATRRHYHATCSHVHTAGVKAGMRFHHHQLEKIRKHQRAHLRKACAVEGSLCPDVLPPDVQAALLRAGAECHEPNLWSAATTEKLKTLVEQQHQRSGGGRVAWDGVANNMKATRLPASFSLTPAQCMLHWRIVVNQGGTVQGVGTWCEAEDRRLGALVQHYKQAWSSVARFMPGREAKQCRERYNNIVDPSINKGAAWTPVEDDLLQRLYLEYGSRFAEVAKRLPGHSYNDVKNRFYILQRGRRAGSTNGKRPNTRLNPVFEDSAIAPVNGSESTRGVESSVCVLSSLEYQSNPENLTKESYKNIQNSTSLFVENTSELPHDHFSGNQIASKIDFPTNHSWPEDSNSGAIRGLGVVPEGQEYEYGYNIEKY